MLQHLLPKVFLAALCLAIPLDSSSAQECAKTFGPLAPTFQPPTSTSYDQLWCVPARGPSFWTFAWCEGNDIYADYYDFDLNRISIAFRVNLNTLDTQDEPAVAFATTGKFLVAWSERHGYDGSGMGIMGRVFDANGIAEPNEFGISQTTFASQWRPLIAPTEAGGWLVAWTGDNDGNSYIRLLDSNGAFLTGDIRVNEYIFDAQVDPAAVMNPNGTIFATFVDFSSHGGVGTGLNLYGRTYDSSGVPLQTQEYLLTTYSSNGDQRDPRVATDGLGRFHVVWSAQLGDGSGYGIYARDFDPTGFPLAPEFPVNTTIAGDQRRPCIAVDQLGRSLITWDDFSQGDANPVIRGRRFDDQGNPAGNDFVVNDPPSGGTTLSNLAIDSTGTEIMVGWQGPGAPGNGVDLYAREFALTTGPHTYCSAKMNSLGCIPAIGFSDSPSATSLSPFTISASNVLSHKLGLLIYGYGSTFTAYQGSKLCVAQPLKRMAAQNSGGSTGATDCTGTLATDFNERIRSGIDPNLVPGATISARWYYRDSHDAAGYGTGLSDAIRFAICP